MQQSCPLCGRVKESDVWEPEFPEDSTTLRGQIENLDRTLSTLSPQEETFLSLLEQKEQMCPMCYEMTDGMNDAQQREDFITRVNTQVLSLQEELQVREEGLTESY